MQFDRLDRHDLHRVNVVGLSGSGKSTFASRLANTLQIEYVEMDRLFHGPNWTEPDEVVFRERVSKAISSERWVLDGNYHSKTHDLKWHRATAVVWVNTPLARNIWQSTCRAIHRSLTQKELWPGTGNKESFRRSFFSRKSIILWALTNYQKIQRRYSSIQRDQAWAHIRFFELRNRQDAAEFLDRAKRVGSL